MNGTFDGVPLRNITPVKTISLKGSTPDTFRVVGGPFPPLERHLRLNALAFDSVPGNRRPSYSYSADLTGMRSLSNPGSRVRSLGLHGTPEHHH
jgi:hypothetical protein